MSAAETLRPRLRVGVVVGDTRVPAWISRLLADLAACPSIELAEVAVRPCAMGEASASNPRRGAHRAFVRVDEALFGRRLDELAPSDLSGWLASRGAGPAEAGVVSLDVRQTGGPARARTPGVTLDLTGGRHMTGGGNGETWWTSGVPLRAGRLDDDLAWVATAVVRGDRVAAFEVRARVPGRDGTVVLVTGACPTHPTSALMTGEYLAASARQFLLEKLKVGSGSAVPPGEWKPTLDRGRASAQPSGEAGPESLARPAGHRPAAMAGPLAGVAYVGRAAGRLAAKAVLEKRWHLLVGEQAPDQLSPDPRRLHPLVPRPGRYWSDPFVVVHGGRTHVFFEEFIFDARRGRIGVITMDDHGRPGPPEVALELESHLSYPFVFTRGDRLFMVPENARAGTVDLYECLDAPGRWVRRRTLLSGAGLVDASLVEWDGLWWMFACLKSPPGLRTADLLMLYFSEDPVSGEWRQHPDCPLLADVTGARPAGAPFVLGGKLYRPAQDGSGGYGWAIALNEVLALTPDRFEEERVATVRPDWAPALCGTHTLNRAGKTFVMDALCRVLRDPRRPRAESMMD